MYGYCGPCEVHILGPTGNKFGYYEHLSRSISIFFSDSHQCFKGLVTRITAKHFYRPQRSLRQGNVFTPVCDSVHRRGGLCPSGRGVCLGRGYLSQGVLCQGDPSGQTPRTVKSGQYASYLFMNKITRCKRDLVWFQGDFFCAKVAYFCIFRLI